MKASNHLPRKSINFENTVNKVAILGGGAAGWLTAGRIAAAFPHLHVCLVESPNQPILGVGEGTWPSMRETLRKIGIDEFDFVRQCDASFKQGSWFTAWHAKDDKHGYCHPFTTPLGYQETNIHDVWRTMQDVSGSAELSYAGAISPQAVICRYNKAPKQKTTPAYAGVLNYGYHLDAHKFAAMLAQHCIKKLNVQHILDDVIKIKTNDEIGLTLNDITHLITANSGEIEADMYIDCSGIKARLISEHYKVALKPVNALINNAAVAAHVPYQENSEIAACTIATAKSDGWIWDIGLSTRRGVGMVFSTEHNTHEHAKQSLMDYIKQTSPNIDISKINCRNLSFTPGYRETFWTHNCLAIGMSAGFVEPLEASALAMVELSINMLIDEFPKSRSHMNIVAKRFNKRFSYRWARAVDFIHLHYLCSKRDDSAYWQRMTDTSFASERLQDLLDLWQYQPPSRHDLIQNEEIFPSASYQFVLYGMGFTTLTNQTTDPATLQHQVQQLYKQNQQKLSQMQQGLPSTHDLLNHINNPNDCTSQQDKQAGVAHV